MDAVFPHLGTYHVGPGSGLLSPGGALPCILDPFLDPLAILRSPFPLVSGSFELQATEMDSG